MLTGGAVQPHGSADHDHVTRRAVAFEAVALLSAVVALSISIALQTHPHHIAMSKEAMQVCESNEGPLLTPFIAAQPLPTPV